MSTNKEVDEELRSTITNIFNLLLDDPFRYHVAISAIKTSVQPNVAKRQYEIAKPNIFKEMLQEGKHSTRNTTNAFVPPSLNEGGGWKEYHFCDLHNNNSNFGIGIDDDGSSKYVKIS